MPYAIAADVVTLRIDGVDYVLRCRNLTLSDERDFGEYQSLGVRTTNRFPLQHSINLSASFNVQDNCALFGRPQASVRVIQTPNIDLAPILESGSVTATATPVEGPSPNSWKYPIMASVDITGNITLAQPIDDDIWDSRVALRSGQVVNVDIGASPTFDGVRFQAFVTRAAKVIAAGDIQKQEIELGMRGVRCLPENADAATPRGILFTRLLSFTNDPVEVFVEARPHVRGEYHVEALFNSVTLNITNNEITTIDVEMMSVGPHL